MGNRLAIKFRILDGLWKNEEAGLLVCLYNAERCGIYGLLVVGSVYEASVLQGGGMRVIKGEAFLRNKEIFMEDECTILRKHLVLLSVLPKQDWVIELSSMSDYGDLWGIAGIVRLAYEWERFGWERFAGEKIGWVPFDAGAVRKG